MLDEFVLAIEHQLAEAALAVGFDGGHVQIRRVIAVRIARHVGAIHAGGVLVALLVDVQISEPRVEQPAVGPLPVLVHVLFQRCRAVDVGEGDAHDPQRVLDELAIGAFEALKLHRLGRCGAKFAIEHAPEGGQALERL